MIYGFGIQSETTSGGGGVTTIGDIDTGTPSANGGSIDGATLYFQSASDTVPGLVNIGEQTFTGQKTFLSPIILDNRTAGSVLFMDASKRIAEDNANFFWDDTNNIFYLGANSGAFTNSKIHAEATVNSYSQINSVNKSNGTSASTDFIVTADTGTDSINYGDFGINSSTYSDAAFTISGALDTYLYGNGGNLVMGTATAAKTIKLHTGGTLAANLRMTIADSTLAMTGLSTTNTFTGQTSNAVVSGYNLINSTTASSSNQQYSPYILWQGNGWKTAATAASQTVAFRAYVIPQQDVVNPTAYLTFESSINGASFTNMINMLSTGNIGINTTTPNAFGWSRALGISQVTSGNNVGIELYGNRTTIDQSVGGINVYNSASARIFGMTVYRGGANNSGYMSFETAKAGAFTRAFTISEDQRIMIGTSTTPTARLHIQAASATTASSAPLKLTDSGANILATAEEGAIEFGDSAAGSVNVLYFTRSGTTRETILTAPGLSTGETNVVDTTRSFHVIDQITGATIKLIVAQ